MGQRVAARIVRSFGRFAFARPEGGGPADDVYLNIVQVRPAGTVDTFDMGMAVTFWPVTTPDGRRWGRAITIDNGGGHE